MIDITKKYRTRDGREVRIYAVDGVAPYPVHGAIKLADDDWEMVAWRSDGRLGGYSEGDCDLIEVRPRIQREVWVNVYRGREMTIHEERDEADDYPDNHKSRIACVRLTIGGEAVMSLVPNETEQALNRQYDVYAAAREEYRRKIAEQAVEIDRLRAALEDVVASGLLHGPTTLSDKVLGIVHAALETPKPRSTEGAIDPEAT